MCSQGYFATSPISAPFGDTYGLTGPGLWSKMGEEEYNIYARILGTTKTSMDKCEVHPQPFNQVVHRASEHTKRSRCWQYPSAPSTTPHTQRPHTPHPTPNS